MDKSEIRARERKVDKKKKNNNGQGKYSSKHIRQYEEMLEWKKINNRKKGSKSRQIK